MNSFDSALATDTYVQDWTYGAIEDGAKSIKATLSIYADRAIIRSILAEDGKVAGLRIGQNTALSSLTQTNLQALSDIVLIDCPVVDAATLAALAAVDQAAATSGVRLIISTHVDALDDVFGCLDQSGAQILVEPSRVERVVALSNVVAQIPSGRVRELSSDERDLLVRLTEQVGQIAGSIERLNPLSNPSEFGVKGSPSSVFTDEAKSSLDDLGVKRSIRSPLPDPRLVRRIIRQRQLRSRFFDPQYFADPAWDMLLDLTAARAEHRRVSVTSLCIASGVPPTTALRWIGQMVDQGIFARVGDQVDRRRAFIELSDRSVDAMARYFELIGDNLSTV